MRDLYRLVLLLKPYWGWMALSALLSLVTVLANVALMATSGWFITAMALAGVAGVSMNYFTPAAMIRAFAITRTGGRYAERLVSHEATFRLLAQLRVWLYERLEPLAPGRLAGARSADIATRLQGDLDRLEQVFLRFLSPVAVAVVASVITIGAVTVWSWQLALVLAVLLVLAGIVVPMAMERIGRAQAVAVTMRSADLNVALTDALEGLGELEASGAAEAAMARLEQTAAEVVTRRQTLATLTGAANAAIGFAASFGVLLTLILLVPAVSAKQLSGPELAMLSLLMLAAFEAIAPIPLAVQTLAGTLASARRIFALADAAPLVRDPAVPGPRPADTTVRFKNVTFAYPGQARAALTGFDLELRAGAKVGVVGPSGAGKSSLAALLMRFYDPSAGEIRFGGVRLDELSGEDVRERISLAPQQPYLFTGTIAHNLRLARPDAPTAMLEQACAVAQIHDFVAAQPDGCDTFVGAAGMKLSGGQVRRLGIARALLKDAPILILDEPTEGLDAATARAMIDAVLVHAREKTVLMITHSPIGLEALDEVVVLEEGRRQRPHDAGSQ